MLYAVFEYQAVTVVRGPPREPRSSMIAMCTMHTAHQVRWTTNWKLRSREDSSTTKKIGTEKEKQ